PSEEVQRQLRAHSEHHCAKHRAAGPMMPTTVPIKHHRSQQTNPSAYACPYVPPTHRFHISNTLKQKGFYIAVGLLPLSFALYRFSRMNTDEQPAFTRWINSYSNWKEKWTDRNDLHTRMIEQAGADRNLFLNTMGSGKVNLKFP
ncbi:hypothetical protein LTR16_010042, partial [Cryomyces antarcticus]